MQRSSHKIGALATALAKAEIANPEKSLTATIESPFPREGQRTFRYASLSSGRDIVRKCLGQHESATLQATANRPRQRPDQADDHASPCFRGLGFLRLAATETAAPHRKGAALTYARRYALFTLVGIAGEVDLDAPDLAFRTVVPDPKNGPAVNGNGPGTFPGRRRQSHSRRLATPMARRFPPCRVRPRRACGSGCWPSWKRWNRWTWTGGHCRHGQRQTR